MSFPVIATSSGVPRSDSQAGEKKGVYLQYEVKPGFTIRRRHNIDPAMDPKKLKRIIANRVSAQNSRLKKVIYLDSLVKRSMELERRRKKLCSKIEIAIEEKQYQENEQKKLNENISARLQDCIDKDGITDVNKSEIEMLEKNIALITNLT
ncbi:PREDICTED: basic leucine zipper 19-like [Camelina sativa]|uniref:Basic leucine zipper 19-like n=1 Tax=Camelina sativa TaxID=90675 RepID=A0ABM0VF08_CAMSA|nr:PREDICTED: basic leucine zipper 19-like [Camelina sativa]